MSSGECELNINSEDNVPKASGHAEQVSFVVVHRKEKIPYKLNEKTTIAELKSMIALSTRVPEKYQKLFSNNVTIDDDNKTLADLNLASKNAKILLMGSVPAEIERACNAVKGSQSNAESIADVADRNLKWFEQKEHNTVMTKHAKPDDAIPVDLVAMGATTEAAIMFNLINQPLTGMMDKRGVKLRLTVKPDLGQVWIATTDRTNKVSLSTIRAVDSHPLEQDKEFSIMYIQLGPTEKSRFFIYYVPTPFTKPLKVLLLQTSQLPLQQ